ncbi:MAG TPA: hypothetical protein VF193_14140 [Steroidobacter sp.]
MAILKRIWSFKGGGFGMTLWTGNRGDFSKWRIPEPVKREERSAVSFVPRGSFLIEPPKGSGVEPWHHRAGEHSGNLPDFAAAGVYRVVAEEDGSMEMCMARCDDDGRITYEDFWWQPVTGTPGTTVLIPNDTVVMIGSGALDAGGGKILRAPHVAHVRSGEREVAFSEAGTILLYRREAP